MDKIWKGSSKKLLGQCVVLSVFVSDDDEQKWTSGDKNKTLEIIEQAIEWISEQAEPYSVEFEFSCESLNPDTDIRVEELPGFGTDLNLKLDTIQQVIEQLGYDDATAFYESIEAEYEGYNIAVLFFMNKEDRSYMIPININHANEFLDININFKSPNTHLPYVSVVAHELLHAFTAQDLYNVSLTPEGEAAAKRAAARFPKEIMHYCGANVNEILLSEYTAFLIGWHNEPQKWYLDIAQPDKKKALEFYLRTHENFDEEGELIIEDEEHIAHYFNEEREFNRYMVNNNDLLYVWREYIYETESEVEYAEAMEGDNEFYLTSQVDGSYITVSKKGGWSWLKNPKTFKYETKLFQMSLGNVSTDGNEEEEEEEEEGEYGEHVEYFYNDEREFNRYLHHKKYTWWEYIFETEEEYEYIETGADQNYYYLHYPDDGTKMTIPKKSGTCWLYNEETKKYENFYEIERGDVADYGEEE